jgi:hypothetical protein
MDGQIKSNNVIYGVFFVALIFSTMESVYAGFLHPEDSCRSTKDGV